MFGLGWVGMSEEAYLGKGELKARQFYHHSRVSIFTCCSLYMQGKIRLKPSSSRKCFSISPLRGDLCVTVSTAVQRHDEAFQLPTTKAR
jgi:hypothetical protein